MIHNLKGFTEQLKGFEKVVRSQFIAIHKKLCFRLYDMILKKTPIDKGFLRGCWGLSIGRPKSRGKRKLSGGSKNSLGADEMKHANEVLGVLSSLPAGQIVWLSNDMPYCEVVEFGMYPKNPKMGSRTKRRGKWGMEIRSAGGFSKQAPAGMVQISVNELQTYIQSLVAGQEPPTDAK